MKRRRTGVGPGDTGHLQANVRSSARRRPPHGEVARDSESSRRDLSGNAPGNHRNICKYHTKYLHSRPLQSHVRAIILTLQCVGGDPTARSFYIPDQNDRAQARQRHRARDPARGGRAALLPVAARVGAGMKSAKSEARGLLPLATGTGLGQGSSCCCALCCCCYHMYCGCAAILPYL